MRETVVLCATCDNRFRSQKRAGRRVFCPSCNGSARVPQVDDDFPVLPTEPQAVLRAKPAPKWVESAKLQCTDSDSEFVPFESDADLDPVDEGYEYERAPKKKSTVGGWFVKKLISGVLIVFFAIVFAFISYLIPDGYDGEYEEIKNGMTRAQVHETMDHKYQIQRWGKDGKEIVYTVEEKEGGRRSRRTVIYTYRIQIVDDRVVGKRRSKQKMPW